MHQIGAQTGDRGRRWRGEIDHHFVHRRVAGGVAGGVCADRSNAIGASAQALTGSGEIELPGAGGGFAEGQIGAQDIGAAVDANTEVVAAAKGTTDGGLGHVGGEQGDRWRGRIGAVDHQLAVGAVGCAVARAVGSDGSDAVGVFGQRLWRLTQIELPGAGHGFGERGISAQNVGAAVEAHAESIAGGEGAADGGLREVGGQCGHGWRRWRRGIDDEFVAGIVGTAVVSAIGGNGGDVIGALAHGHASGDQVELPGAGAGLGQRGISAQDVGDAVDAHAESVAAGKGAGDGGLGVVAGETGDGRRGGRGDVDTDQRHGFGA